MDDKELQHKAHAGDQAAFTELAGRCYPALCRHATYLVQDNDVAEDIVQEALLRHTYVFVTIPSAALMPGPIRSLLIVHSTICARKKIAGSMT